MIVIDIEQIIFMQLKLQSKSSKAVKLFFSWYVLNDIDAIANHIIIKDIATLTSMINNFIV